MSEAYLHVRETAKPPIAGDNEQKRFTRRLPHLLSSLFRIWEIAAVWGTGLAIEARTDVVHDPVAARLMAHDIAFVTVIAAFCLHFNRAYHIHAFIKPLSAAKALTSAFGCLVLILVACHLLTAGLPEFFQGFGACWMGAAVGVIALARAIGLVVIARRAHAGLMKETVAIVGGGARGQRLMDYIVEECSDSAEIIGLFDDRDTDRLRAQWESRKERAPTGTIDDLVALCKDKRVTRIIVAFPLSADDRLHQVFRKLKSLSIDILLCPDDISFSLLNLNVGAIGSLPLLKVADAPFGGFSYFTKLLEDKILAGLALTLLSPIMILAAVAIKLESPGPILFRQLRYGFNNQPFKVYKFRSMYWQQSDHVCVQQVTRQDSRVTRVGRLLRRTSIDELPQLFNVLEGTMSMVGPRPHAVGMRTANLLCEEIVETYEHRHRVKPGITGWAQVNGSRGPTETPRQLVRRVELDLYYIENWSVYLDIKILILTALKLFNDDLAF
jgi:Undecaprenyl-phosphate glucose phosphotransferase